MKNIQKIVVCFALSFCSSWLTNAQSSDQNWVKTTTYKKEGQQDPVHEITYFDGLGRPIQKVANAQSNSGKDIITPIEYDVYGRQVKDYLPYVNQAPSLNYNASALSDQAAYYNTAVYQNTANPFSEKLLEASPLDRVLKQAAPGYDWRMNGGHEIKLDYSTNTAGEVKYYTVSTSWNASKQLFEISIANPGNYDANELFKNSTTDENGVVIHEFKDKEGQVILKRVFNNNDAHDTYYIYDNFGNLTYVIPPLANGAFDQNTLDGLCYQYKYDNLNRVVAKKLPGKQWEYIVYDKLDRPVATGPVFSPYGDGAIGVMVTQYDILGRVTQTGWLAQTVNETNRGSWQTTINGGSNPFVLATNDILTKNYYDTYTFPNAPNIPSAVEGQPVTTAVKGLATGSWVRILNNANTIVGETSYTLYDSKYRPIRTSTSNYLGGFTQVDSKLDFIGKALYTITTHKRTNADALLTVRDNFTYSAQDRLVKHTQQINGGAEQLIASNTYDELGQLTSKKVGGLDASGQTGLQKVDYTYNIRGWLKGINDVANLSQASDPKDLFAFKLNYNDYQAQGANDITPQALFNGNISSTYWVTANDNTLRKYNYNYDNLNRLSLGTYLEPNSSTSSGTNFTELLNYDKNGNITHLERYDNLGRIDNLDYTYDTAKNKNQLMKVIDTSNSPQGFKDDSNGSTTAPADDYVYDANGNMTKDNNKGITSISYNHFNLPVEIIFNNNSQTKISYLYDATGKKVKKMVTLTPAPTWTNPRPRPTTTETDYLSGGFQYKSNTLLFFPQADGYVNVTNGNFNYVFNYTDHLGNVRLSYADTDGNGILGNEPQIIGTNPTNGNPVTVLTNGIVEESNYYPFGLKHTAYNTNNFQANYAYKYNGKELQDELGLNMYDYGARLYDPATARWYSYDPLAEQMRRWSPYNYSFNNPLRFIDPDGMGPNDVIITGAEKQKAFEQLQNATKGQLNLTMNNDGKVEATAVEGATLTEASQTFLNATTDQNVNVNVNATDQNIMKDGTIIIGGEFGGSKKEDGVINASQTVNPTQMEKIDTLTQRGNGVGTIHEVIEAYVGAKNSNGKDTTTGSKKEKAYENAHKEARRIDPRHKELTGTSPNTKPYILPNGDGTFQVDKRIEYNGKRAPLFLEKRAKISN